MLMSLTGTLNWNALKSKAIAAAKVLIASLGNFLNSAVNRQFRRAVDFLLT